MRKRPTNFVCEKCGSCCLDPKLKMIPIYEDIKSIGIFYNIAMVGMQNVGICYLKTKKN